MRCERVGSAADARGLADAPSVRGIEKLVSSVRRKGDRAVLQWSRMSGDADPVQPDGSEPGLAPELGAALELAAENVRRVAEASLDDEREIVLSQGQTVVLREEAVRSAGIYVPGGRAPYPSSVVMGVVTAKVAGVEDVAVISPPGSDGRVHPAIVGAARLTGASRVHCAGGAQAIAALAYGTETIPPVDVIAGPGNEWVTEAKRQVFGHVGIDGLAGPSDVLVLAAADADPEQVALDLLAQAEHGRGTLSVLVSTSRAVLGAVAARVAPERDTGAVIVLVEVANVDEGLRWAEEFAPEHMELLGSEVEARAADVRAAGCLFVGTGTAFGDYVAGSNHTLPTGGAARWGSGLSPRVFRRRFAEVRVPPGAAHELAPPGAAIARAEGFEVHARSMEARMERT